MKQCISCNNQKLLEDFYKDKSMPDGYTQQCKACRKARAKATHEKYKDKRNFGRKYRHLKDLYGLDYKKYNTILMEQKNKCSICKCSMTKPYVDHNHTTGKVRDLLCHHCNSLIGFAKDDTKILKKAIDYLNKF